MLEVQQKQLIKELSFYSFAPHPSTIIVFIIIILEKYCTVKYFKVGFPFFKRLEVSKLYNLSLFGKKVKEIRSKLRLKQDELSELSGVNVEAIRRLEQGKVVPKLETIENLSPVLKVDLHEILLKYRIDDYIKLDNIIKNLEAKFDRDEFYTLKPELLELESLLPAIKNYYYRNQTKQLILLIQGIILYKQENKFEQAFKVLVQAIKTTTPDFTFYQYSSFTYSTLEIRILMNLGFVLNRLERQEEYLEIIRFCISEIDESNLIYPKLCHNLAGAYRRMEKFDRALFYSKLGIDSCYRNRNLNGIYFLFYGKAVSEFNLGDRSYANSFKKAVSLCELFREYNIKESMIKRCKDNYGLDLSKIDNSFYMD